MPLVLVPLVGPFHLRFPRYNVVTVREQVAAVRPAAVLTTALHADDALSDPAWQELEEPALTMTVVPWARRAGVPVEPVGSPSPDPEAAASFDAFVGEAGPGRAALQELETTRGPLVDLLSGTLDLNGVRTSLVPAVEAYQRARATAFGDGPGTDWIEERADAMTDRILHAAARHAGRPVVVALPVDHLPAVRRRLEARASAQLHDPEPVPASHEARARALRDAALAEAYDDPATLLTALREQEGPEARYAEAEVLVQHGHAAEALSVLRDASRGDFTSPPQLPGWLLARLGQLYDLDGRRDDARRAYRGVLALSWAPAAAREAARQGMEAPFGQEVASDDAPHDDDAG
ncbi:MAG: hypothetical protein WD336_09750 [Trueperaceae bacterium]